MTTQDSSAGPAPATEYGYQCPYVASGATTLRCSKCNRPLMPKDAKRTPTGYVCPYYVKARVATFYNAGIEHYVLVAIVALVLGAISGFVLGFVGNIGFFALILVIFVGPAVGALVAEAIRRVLGHVRGMYFWLTAAIAMAVGAIFLLLPSAFSVLGGNIFSLIPFLGLGLAVSALVARMRI